MLDQFVCVRIVKANGLDLSLFQFDFDLTFSAFFLNPDGTVYGRFGSRSSAHEAAQDISLEGFAAALEGALEFHRDYPANKASLAGKQAPAPRFARPEEFPSLRGKYTKQLTYEKNVAGSCIHCHMVRDAEREFYRAEGTPFSDRLTFPWPMPDVLGLRMDPKERATITSVRPASAASAAGFKPGDRIRLAEGQPPLSTADLQWILERKTDGESLRFVVERAGAETPIQLVLPPGWRREVNIDWRATTWELRRMAMGGLVLKELPEADRREKKLEGMALVVDYVGQYGEHAAGKNAGFQKGDLIVAIDAITTRHTESQALALLTRTRKKGESATFTLLRGPERLELKLLMQ